MTFEFLIVYQPKEDEPILDILRDRLRDAFDASLTEADDDGLERMFQTNFGRARPADEDGRESQMLSFSLEIPDETESLDDVIDEFTSALTADPVEHAVKCEDPLLRAELADRAEELFVLEMKLRRVLSIIYLFANPETDPFDLLRDETVQPMTKDAPTAERMKSVSENQFFYLTFGQYVSLNRKPAIKDLAALISKEETYEDLRAEIQRQPVEHEDDADFLASLKDRLNAIEKMRNAVAHNRKPSKKTTENYLNALPQVNQALDDYLAAVAADWQDSLDQGESPWGSAAREAVEQALESATWDGSHRTISLHEASDPSRGRTVGSRTLLVDYLQEVAGSAFYGACGMDDEGNFLSICDENDIVEGVLTAYEDRVEALFGSPG